MLQPWHMRTCTPTCLLSSHAHCFGICISKAASSREALHMSGGFIPASIDRFGIKWAVLWIGNAVTFLLHCSPPPQACLTCFSRSLDSCGLLYPWWGPKLMLSTELNTRHWITVWYASGCQIFDSLFLMKIPPVIPRISRSAKNELCVYFAVGWIFPCFSQFPPWTERKGRGKQLTAFFVVVLLLDFCEICGDQLLTTNKMFLFLFAKAYGNCRKSIWVFLGKHIGEWTNYSGANMFWVSG